MAKKVNSKNFLIVLDNLKKIFEKEDKNIKKYYAEALNAMLDEMASMDTFGTEQQLDPRGDFRDD